MVKIEKTPHSALNASLDRPIGTTATARYYYATFQWNDFASVRVVYAVEDLSGNLKESTILKGSLDLLRDKLLESEEAAEYSEVIPRTLNCYMDDLTVHNNGVILYEIGQEGADCALEVLDLHPAKKLTADTVVWITERLLRIVEVLHADDIVLELDRPLYLVEWQKRILRIMDFSSFRYVRKLSHHDVRLNLMQIAHVIRQLGDFSNSTEVTDALSSFLGHIENSPPEFCKADPYRQVSELRRSFMQLFPSAQ